MSKVNSAKSIIKEINRELKQANKRFSKKHPYTPSPWYVIYIEDTIYQQLLQSLTDGEKESGTIGFSLGYPRIYGFRIYRVLDALGHGIRVVPLVKYSN